MDSDLTPEQQLSETMATMSQRIIALEEAMGMVANFTTTHFHALQWIFDDKMRWDGVVESMARSYAIFFDDAEEGAARSFLKDCAHALFIHRDCQARMAALPTEKEKVLIAAFKEEVSKRLTFYSQSSNSEVRS